MLVNHKKIWEINVAIFALKTKNVKVKIDVKKILRSAEIQVQDKSHFREMVKMLLHHHLNRGLINIDWRI